MKGTKLIKLIVSLVPLMFTFIIPGTEALSSAGVASICVLITILLLLLTDALPIAISCLFGLVLMIVFKAVPTANAAFSGFSNNVVWFVLISFGISHSISSTNLSRRMLAAIMVRFGANVKTIIFAIMLCTAVLSSVVSNVAALMIFMSVCFGFLSIYEKEEDKRQTGKTIMIALPIASMLGGMITPAGSSLNLLCLGFLEELTGLRVSFVQWMVIAIPVLIILIPTAWKVVVFVNKPVEVSAEKLAAFIDETRVKEKFSFQEKYVVAVVSGMIVCWILGSWFPIFNVVVVAGCGLTLMFLPGIVCGVDVITWDSLMQEISWPAIILLGSIISVGNILGSSGASAWFVSSAMPASLSLPAFAVSFIVAVIVFAMLVVIPVAPALISIFSAPLVGLAAAAGVSPVLLMMTMALTVCNCFLLPFDTVPVITYMKGYYKISDLAKTAIWIQFIIAVVVAAWLPIILVFFKF